MLKLCQFSTAFSVVWWIVIALPDCTRDALPELTQVSGPVLPPQLPATRHGTGRVAASAQPMPPMAPSNVNAERDHVAAAGRCGMGVLLEAVTDVKVHTRAVGTLIGGIEQRMGPVEPGVHPRVTREAQPEAPGPQVVAGDLRGQWIDQANGADVIEGIEVRLARLDAEQSVQLRGAQLRRAGESRIPEVLCFQVAPYAVHPADRELLVIDQRFGCVLAAGA